MANIVRFGVSLNRPLLEKFDELIAKEEYSNRSEAIRDLVREKLKNQEWADNKEVAGTITLVFDHHKRELLNSLTNIQHDFHNLIISTQHIHLDHDNCMEIIVVRGKSKNIYSLTNKLRATVGVKHADLTTTTIGRKI